MPIRSQMSQESVDLQLAHLLRVAFAMEQDVAPDPRYVGPLCAETQVLGSRSAPGLVEQLGLSLTVGAHGSLQYESSSNKPLDGFMLDSSFTGLVDHDGIGRDATRLRCCEAF